jgi:hypothetical protein
MDTNRYTELPMAQLNVKLSADRLAALRRYAARRRTPVAWLIKDYVDYLIGGGAPVVAVEDDPSSSELANLAQETRTFDWLADEPDLYSAEDGEAV